MAFDKNLIDLYVLFYFHVKERMIFQLSAKTTCLGKICFLSHGPKSSRPIRIQDYLNCNAWQTSWGMKLKICMWLDMYRDNKNIWLLQFGSHPFSRYAIFFEKLTFLIPWYAHLRTCAYQGVRNNIFSKKCVPTEWITLRYACACPEWWQKISQRYLKNELWS